MLGIMNLGLKLLEARSVQYISLLRRGHAYISITPPFHINCNVLWSVWGDVMVQCPSIVANLLTSGYLTLISVFFFCYFPHCNVSFSWKASELGL